MSKRKRWNSRRKKIKSSLPILVYFDRTRFAVGTFLISLLFQIFLLSTASQYFPRIFESFSHQTIEIGIGILGFFYCAALQLFIVIYYHRLNYKSKRLIILSMVCFLFLASMAQILMFFLIQSSRSLGWETYFCFYVIIFAFTGILLSILLKPLRLLNKSITLLGEYIITLLFIVIFIAVVQYFSPYYKPSFLAILVIFIIHSSIPYSTGEKIDLTQRVALNIISPKSLKSSFKRFSKWKKFDKKVTKLLGQNLLKGDDYLRAYNKKAAEYGTTSVSRFFKGVKGFIFLLFAFLYESLGEGFLQFLWLDKISSFICSHIPSICP